MEIDQQKEEGVKMFRRLSSLVGVRRFMLGLVCIAALLLATEIGAQPRSTHEITISAAISLKNAFEGIAIVFQERNPGAKTVI